MLKSRIPLFFVVLLTACQTWTVVDDDMREEIFISSPATPGQGWEGLPCDTYTKGYFSYSGKAKKITIVAVVTGEQPMRIVSLRDRKGEEHKVSSITRKINYVAKCVSTSMPFLGSVIASSTCTQDSTHTSTVFIPMSVSSLKGIEEDLEIRAYTNIDGVFADCLYSAAQAKKFLQTGRSEAQYNREWIQ